MVMHPPPTPCTLYPLPCMGINKLADVVACRLPQGVPLRRQIFLSSTPRRATSCKPHTHDDVFSASAVKSPSNAFNLVGRWLLLAETCSRRPSRKRPRVGLLSLAAPADCARANPTGDFAAKNIKSRRYLLLHALGLDWGGGDSLIWSRRQLGCGSMAAPSLAAAAAVLGFI